MKSTSSKAKAKISKSTKPSPAPKSAESSTKKSKAPAKKATAAAHAPAAVKTSSPTTVKAPVQKTAPAAASPARLRSNKSRQVAPNGVESRMAVKKVMPRSEYKTGENIVYPAHGVGRIVGIDTQEVAGIKLDLFVIAFLKDKMTLRVPVTKANTVGMRKLADAPTVKKALETVRGRARIKRTMWSRRAQEYEAKINSGDLIAIAEVVRDLYRSETQPEQSYSERQLYEAALDRMSREISSVNRISETEAVRQIEQNLAKSPRRGAKPENAEARDRAA